MSPAGVPRGYAACTGCSLCRLVCPMWRTHRDPRFCAEGLAKARQSGVAADALAAALDACSLCGACDRICPEDIDLTGMILGLRAQARGDPADRVAPSCASEGKAAEASRALLLPGTALRADPDLLERIRMQLGATLGEDDGADLVAAIEAGGAPAPSRWTAFVRNLAGRRLVVGDGLLLAQLCRAGFGDCARGLGEALGGIGELRRRIARTDFYVIDARASHADHPRLVAHYDRLRRDRGCAMNLDLNRLAVPARASGIDWRAEAPAAADLAQARWLLQAHEPARIVVEDAAMRVLFREVTGVPVLHLAELAGAPDRVRSPQMADH